MRARCSPGMLWTGLGVSVAAGAASKTVEFVAHGTKLAHDTSTLYEPLHVVAYVLIFHFCRKISSDHRDASTMRLAWLLMAASCATSVVRHGFEWTTYLLGWHNTELLTTVVSLRQIPTVLAMSLMTASLVAMWSSFAAIGLGVRFRWRDGLFALIVLALMAADLGQRGNMWDVNSEYPLMRQLQELSPVMIALPALLGLVLQRISEEMRGGEFAQFLRFLVWSLLLRLASLLTTFSPSLRVIWVVAVVGTAAFWAAPWLLALAVVRRWRLTESLDQLAEVYDRDPAEGFAILAADRKQFRTHRYL